MAVLTYRNVKGSNLTANEVDANFHNLDDRTTVNEDAISGLSEIASAYINTAGELILVKESSEEINAGTLPTAGNFTDLFRGAWQTSTSYAVNDLFTANGRLWAVIYAHTSDSSEFSSGANDGGGHDYYQLVIDYTSIDGKEISDTTYSPTPDDEGRYLRFTGASCAITIDPSQDFGSWCELHIRDETSSGCTYEIISTTAEPAAINPQYNCNNASPGQGCVVGLKRVGDTNDWDIWGRLIETTV